MPDRSRRTRGGNGSAIAPGAIIIESLSERLAHQLEQVRAIYLFWNVQSTGMIIFAGLAVVMGRAEYAAFFAIIALLLSLYLYHKLRLHKKAVDDTRALQAKLGFSGKNASLLNGASTRWVTAPGSRSQQILRFVFSKKAFDNVFSQAIADMRDEHCEALLESRPWKARWIVWRGHIGLWFAVVSYLASTVVKRVVDVWKLTP